MRIAAVYGTEDQARLVEERAAAHGLSRSGFLLASSLSDVQAQMSPEDRWWLSLTSKQKESYFRWLSEGKKKGRALPAELGLVELPFDMG